ncbi:hypothetical protein GGH95_005320 [Coemansia sp. RSA 1836]|nr:hypothetical protein GGH95_005320 [Coemansia sp. RSA 1836]
MDALNSTLGFHRVYVTYDDNDSSGLDQTQRATGHKANFEAIARLLDIDVQFIKTTTTYLEKGATTLQRQRGFTVNNVSRIAELDTHRRIYADMAANNVQSALILGSQVDVEVDLKMRLAEAMSKKGIVQSYDILFLGQKYSDQLSSSSEEEEETSANHRTGR